MKIKNLFILVALFLELAHQGFSASDDWKDGYVSGYLMDFKNAIELLPEVKEIELRWHRGPHEEGAMEFEIDVTKITKEQAITITELIHRDSFVRTFEIINELKDSFALEQIGQIEHGPHVFMIIGEIPGIFTVMISHNTDMTEVVVQIEGQNRKTVRYRRPSSGALADLVAQELQSGSERD
jgi:hypothetical protein